MQFVKGWNLLYTLESVCFMWCNDQVHKLGLTNLAEVTSLDFAKRFDRQNLSLRNPVLEKMTFASVSLATRLYL